MLFHIAVTDDRIEDARHLADDIRKVFGFFPQHSVSVQVFQSAEAMLESSGPGVFNLAFLDILMDGLNGIELAKRLRDSDVDLLIVFLTSSPEFAFDAFPVHPFDYLLKPYDTDSLRRVISEAIRTVQREEAVFSIRAAYATYQIPARSIISAVAQGHAVELHITDAQPVRSIMTFSDVRQLLITTPCFLECNRGVIVNMDHVTTLENGVLHLNNGSVFPLRTRNRSELISRFTQYQISRLKGG